MKKKTATPGTEQTAAIDWRTIHRRLATAQTAIERGLVATAEEKKVILKARAKALAHEPEKTEVAGDRIEIVEFLLGQEKYGIESSYVREVYPLKEVTPLPCTPPFVLGIINVRGQILSVIDLKNFFDMPAKGLTDLNKVIIIYSANMEFGVLADVILGVRHVSLRDLQTSLPTLTGVREEFLKGVSRQGVTILEAEKLLSDKKIVVHEEVRA